MQRLIECVPNFSEGRRAETVNRLVAAVRSVPGVFLLDQEMDADHHRSVLTFVGEPDAVGEAAFRVTQAATELIDLRRHEGEHPRVGATDVVPFVPIRGVTMGECVALAKRVGARIGSELRIPVFLYERAAANQDRARLEVIRKGGLEGLAGRMTAQAWQPDFGPAALHPTAGATVVGARPPLIAYNVNLQTDDLEAAKTIAKKVRFSSGGLPAVKAIGVELRSRGLVQVSMNLTNFEETPIHVAYEAVRREAEQRGIRVVESQVVGLVPQRALVQAAEHLLKLEGFDPMQVLEARLESVLAKEAGALAGTAGDWSSALSPFLDALSAGTPTPGGGSAAALAGALAASLGVMGCKVGPPKPTAGQGQPKPSADEPASLEQMERRLAQLRAELHRLVRADADAYEAVVRAYRLPKEDKARSEHIAASLAAATLVPLETATLAGEVASLLRSVMGKTKQSVTPDLRVGLLLAMAAVEGGLENVAVNLKAQSNQQLISDVQGKVAALQQRLVELKRLCYPSTAG
ncbi:MAG: glutamate formimidoyltransferase [Nitrospirota bacterium]